jgi:hypothetical protein
MKPLCSFGLAGSDQKSKFKIQKSYERQALMPKTRQTGALRSSAN